MSKVLYLHLNSEYFDKIKAGTKTEEYRLCNSYWGKRLIDYPYNNICVMRGYPRRGDAEKRMSFPYRGYQVKTITHSCFGPDPVEVYAIQLKDGE